MTLNREVLEVFDNDFWDGTVYRRIDAAKAIRNLKAGLSSRAGAEQTPILRAIAFARESHAGQKRKYNGKAYVEHPVRVACRVAELECFGQPPPYDADVPIIAALLHDVIEDCGVKLEQIEATLGAAVGAIVWQLTNPPKDDPLRRGLNRAARKLLDRQRMQDWGQTPRIIKLLDRIDNLSEMIVDARTNDEAARFLPVYREESRLLLEALKGTHAGLEGELGAMACAEAAK